MDDVVVDDDELDEVEVDFAVVDDVVLLVLLPATVVDDVDGVVTGTVLVVVANPLGSSIRKVATA